MQYIIIPIIVPLFIHLYSKWALTRASLNQPKTDAEGNHVLFYGIPVFIIALSFAALSIFIVSLLFLAKPTNFILFFLLFSFFTMLFLFPAIMIILEALKARVTITTDGIFARAPWPWYPKTMLWKDIKRVSYSPLSSSLVFEDYQYRVLRISPYFYGIAYFCETMENHLSPEIYKESKSLIDTVFKIQRNKLTNG